MKCPRCQAVLPAADSAGFITCACGARLRTRPGSEAAAAGAVTAAETTQGGAQRGPNGGVGGSGRRGEINPNATLPPGTPLRPIVAPRPEGTPSAASVPVTSASPAGAPSPVALEAILSELRAIKATQHEILRRLRAGVTPPSAEAPAPPDDDEDDAFGGAASAPRSSVAAVRSGRRKSVVLIDDDAATRAAAVAAFEKAEVPVRAVGDGNSALAAIAEDKPDVIVLELGIGGAMAGKDVINMIKATMEWVDIPIVLYTRVTIESQREARQIHGGDEFVVKGPASTEALVTRVVSLFRKG